MKNGIGRGLFFAGVVVVSAVVFYLSFVFATKTEIKIVEKIVVIGGSLIVYLVYLREKNIKSKYQWRRWYSGSLFIVLAISVSLIYFPSISGGDIELKEAQASLGFYMFYLVLMLPVLLSCFLQKSKTLTNA